MQARRRGQRVGQPPVKACWAAVFALFLCFGAVFAAAPTPRVVPPETAGEEGGATEGKTVAPKVKVWTYNDEGRRDPFCFTTLKKLPGEEEHVVRIPGTGAENGTGGTGVKITKEQAVRLVKKEAEAFYRRAEAAVMHGGVKGALNLCDRGLAIFKRLKDFPEQNALPDLRELRERLLRLRKVSERLIRRRQVEIAFAALGIQVSSVIWRPNDARAIINGEVVKKGGMLPVGDKKAGEYVYIDDIHPAQVVMTYRGFKMRLAVATAR